MEFIFNDTGVLFQLQYATIYILTQTDIHTYYSNNIINYYYLYCMKT